MDNWVIALRVALVGFSAVFLGLLTLSGGVKIMSICCRLVIRKEKRESSLNA